MASPLKVRGLIELNQLRDRVRRQYALHRISKGDCECLADLLNQVEAKIISMNEKGVE